MTALTPSDVNKYITMIRINFENAYKAQDDKERELLIKSWYAILREYPKEVCDRAVLEAIKYAKFAPRIGDVVERIEKMIAAYEKDEGELWAELTGVLREVAKQVYYFRFNAIASNGKTQGENARIKVKQIYEGLSPELREYLRGERVLMEISNYTDEELTYERGRFMRLMPEVKERAKTRHAMPDNLSVLVSGMSAYLTLENNDTEKPLAIE